MQLPAYYYDHLLNRYSETNAAGLGGPVRNLSPQGISKGNTDDRIYSLLVSIREILFSDKVGEVTPCGFPFLPFTSDPGMLKTVDSFQGCNMSFRKEVFQHAKFDNWFSKGGPAVGEEVDFCLQVKRKGYELLLDPNLVVIHKRDINGGERKDDSHNYQQRRIRNLTKIVKRQKLGVSGLIFWMLMSILYSIKWRSKDPLYDYMHGLL